MVSTFPEVSDELNNAYHDRESNPVKFYFVVEKFYGGLLYVGAPASCQAFNDLLMVLHRKEQDTISRLYQHALDEMGTLERKISEMKIAGKA